MLIKGIKSDVITSGADIFEELISSLQGLNVKENDIIVITSKVLAVSQNRIVKIKNKEDFNKLVKQQSDYLFKQDIGDQEVPLTVKNSIFIPWAGIDRSNVKRGYAVLWPENSYEVAYQLYRDLKEHYKVKEMGIIISDSFCVPLRKGVSAVSLAHSGFKAVNDLRGEKDLFGNKLSYSMQNVADMLACAAHLVMGESTEQMPFALIKDPPVCFTDNKPDPRETVMDPKECLFEPLYDQRFIENFDKTDNKLTINKKSPK